MRLVLALLCLTVQVHAVSTAGEGIVDIEDAAGDDQLSALFDDNDLGEAGPQRAAETVSLSDKVKSDEGNLGAIRNDAKKRIAFKFKQSQKQSSQNLGESPMTSVHAGPLDRARRMIQLGSLLESVADGQQSYRTSAVSSLKEALQTKLLMDELKPADGSFAQPKSPEEELGEGHSGAEKLGTFRDMLHSKKKDLVAITKYLLQRKKNGRPLSSQEDDELQKFYYDRASTILKKIVLLKRGDEPAPKFSQEAHELDQQPSPDEERAAIEVRLARAHAEAVVERLNFDAKVASANAAYNKKMLNAKERRMKAATEERKQAEKQQLKAAKQKLVYDQKVADSEEKYNEALSAELLQRKKVAEKRVQEASEQKRAADIAAAQATKAAREADKEAQEAELEAEQATQHAEELQEKQLEKNERNQHELKHHMRGQKHGSHPEKAPVHIPLTVMPHAKLQSLLRYLRSALDRHVTVTLPEQELMQSFFLKRGSALLSQLAQVDPDATWHSEGVMREEQYEMDQNRPDQLSKEWGSKNLNDDTVVNDFVADALWSKRSYNQLARPRVQRMVGLFGSNHEVPLKFDADNSAPQTQEPDLGESASVSDVKQAYPGAMSTMLGVGGQ